MRRTIQVYLGSAPRRIGTIRYDQQGARESAAFEYHSDWLTAADRFTIDPALQLVVGPQFHKNAAMGPSFMRLSPTLSRTAGAGASFSATTQSDDRKCAAQETRSKCGRSTTRLPAGG